MVSRGGRSRGCTNCRRRRVKCDETRPVCNRCEKRGLVCDGPKEATWISENKPSPSRRSEKSCTPSDGQSATSSQLGVDVTFAPLEDDVYLAYTHKNLLRAGPVDTACQIVMSRQGASDRPGFALLQDAILSLSTIFFGKQHKQLSTINRGYRLYGNVLAVLNSHLAHPAYQTTNETILTVLTCNLLEIFLPTGKNNFLKHIRGLETILEMRGPPEGVLSAEDHLIFPGLRLLLIVGGLAMSMPTIYARDCWKALPGKQDDENGRLRHQIMNILADCTVLMNMHDNLIRMMSDNWQPLVAQTKAHYRALEALHPLWVEINNAEGGALTGPSGRLHIANQNCAVTYMLYNTAAICLLNIIVTWEPSPKYESIRHASALKIAKCLDFKQFRRDVADAESNTVGFIATRVAWTVFGGFATPEGRRLARTVKTVVHDIFAVGAWESSPEGSPRIDPRSPDRIKWVDDVMETW